MRALVEFQSDKFPPYAGEEEAINPEVWGKRLAEYFQQRLPEHSYSVRYIGAEDWGWMVEIAHEPFPLWLGCSHSGESPDQFLVFIEPRTPSIRKFPFFRKVETSGAVDKLRAALDAILCSDEDIRNIRWSDATG